MGEGIVPTGPFILPEVDPGEVVPSGKNLKLPGQPDEQEAPVFWSAAEDVNLLIAMAPIILGVGFLLIRAAVIRSKPLAEREVARRALGVWPRLMIVFSFIWSALVTGGIAWLNNKGAQIQASLPLAFWTFGPLLALWVVYFAAKWVRQGAKVA